MKKKIWTAALLVALILVIDQVSKFWIKLHFCLGEEVQVFSWFRIHFLENEGMAFGFSLGPDGGKLLLSILRLIAIGALVWYIVRLVKEDHKLSYILPFTLILAGAVGNMIDCACYGLIFSESGWFATAEFMPEGGGYASFLYGRVVDMLYFPLVETTYPSWMPFVGGHELVFFRPVFNIADSAISVGFVWFLIMQLPGLKPAMKSSAVPEAANTTGTADTTDTNEPDAATRA